MVKTLQGLVRNSLWSLIIQFSPRFVDVLLFILIGRLYGPYEGGVFSLASAYLGIAIAAIRGPDDFVTRQVLRTPESTSAYFGAFCVLHLGVALFTYGTLAWIVVGAMSYAALTTQVILLLLLALIPENLIGITQAILLGQQRFHVPALVILAVNLGKLGGGAMILLTGGTLSYVAGVWVLSSLAGMLILVGIVWQNVGWAGPSHWRPIWRQARAILAFLVITVLLALEAQVDTIVLSALHGEVHVGWYRAATTVLFSLAMLAQVYQIAVYPVMTRYALDAPEKLAALYAISLRGLTLGVVPLVISVWWAAPYLIPLVFSSTFQPAIPVLRVLIWALLFIFLNAPHARVMLVCNQQGKIVLFVAASVASNIVINLVLAPRWGALGSAWARVVSSALFCGMSYLFIRRRLIPLSRNFDDMGGDSCKIDLEKSPRTSWRGH